MEVKSLLIQLMPATESSVNKKKVFCVFALVSVILDSWQLSNAWG